MNKMFFMATLGLSLSVVPTADAGQQDFQFGLIKETFVCTPQGDQWPYLVVAYSRVVSYCPYGPQPNWEQSADSAATSAAQAMCALGRVEHYRGGWFGAQSQANATNMFNNACANPQHDTDRCTSIAWSGEFYSTYNNPVNCHP